MAEVDESERPSVRQVCQDFRVREDGVLAQRLQEEEFGNHYIRNRSERKTVREDVKAAKQTYLEEVKNAQIFPDEELRNMGQTEQWLARDLHEKLLYQEVNAERKKTDLESRDEEIARQLQEKEALKLERARQRRLERQLREEQERRMLQEAVMESQADVNEHTVQKENENVQRGASHSARSRNDLANSGEASSYEANSRRKKNSGKDAQERYSLGEGAVVQLPACEGGRLESDRIIMADGTAIDLFDDDDGKMHQQAQKKSREKEDEELARRLQEEEDKLVEQDRQTEDDRRLALEFQDRELAKELQRREYIRLQKLKRERQLRRAQTVPAESTSGSSGELQAQQRLPSYEEAIHRNQIPDLLQDKPTFRREQARYRDESAHRKYSSPERLGYSSSSKRSSFETERDGGSTASHNMPHSSGATALSIQQYCEEERTWSSQNSSPHSSLERSTSVEYSERFQRSSSGSSHSSSQAQAIYEHPHSPTSPDTREGVWEKLYEEGESIPHRRNRGIERSITVATSEPSKHNSDPTDEATAQLINRTDCNIAELIDPTFNRRQTAGDSATNSCNTTNAETKPKPMPLIQPQRRRSSEKKKKEKGGEKDCKQQ